jgi:DNA polymerase
LFFLSFFFLSFLEPVASDPQESIDAPARAADDPGRIAQVMQMDWPTLATTVAGCTACGLAKTRNCTVFGIGDRQARWLLVGEGPGAEEDARGEPFVGQSGRLLDNMLAALEMERGKDVFIANIVKCRPPDNRVPAAAEVAACEPYLHRQIELLQPKVIIALGKTAAVTLLGKERSIASMRGQVFRYRDTPLIVTYHPAYLLRSLPEKAKAWEDLCFARARVREWTEGQALATRDRVPISPPP